MRHLRNSTLLLTSIFLFSCQNEAKTETFDEKVKRVHAEVITIDTHCDINVSNFTEETNYTQRLNTQVDIPKMKEGGLDVAWFIVYTGQGELNEEGYSKAKENAYSKFEAIANLTSQFAPEDIELARSSQEVFDIVDRGKLVAMIGVENAYPIGTDLSEVERYHELGARYISLAHNGHSQFSDSNTGEADDVWLHNGLSELGVQMVAEMNRLGIMIDISHPSKEAIKDMVSLSKAPIIASHSSARALCDHSRNLDDEQLMWIKENGGVVQTVAFSSYLNTEKHNAYSSYLSDIETSIKDSLQIEIPPRRSWSQLDDSQIQEALDNYRKVRGIASEIAAVDENAPEAVSVKDFVDHIDYMVELIGIDHVGISSDFDGGGGIHGWRDASETENVTRELLERGYAEEDIKKLWGLNLLRVLDEVQAVAQKLQE
ncbi:MAG: dipeptidase [Flavobacteriaceae bacterium]|nr:dipeptidase [Flavobacteriaceae bacterium]